MKTKTKHTRMIKAAIALALLSGLASAAFTVQSFSCNSQTGTIVVENGGTLNCQATVKNTGNSAANVSSITILTDGSWAEKTSYTGLGYDKTVQGGSTTTASFGNIKPTTVGVNKFNYIKIDTVTDNYPAASDINVISIKNLVSTAPANASAGETFTVSASVTAGGNVNVVLTLNASGCTLASGELASKNLGTVSDNTVKSASWKLVQGSGACSYAITASGSGGASTVTKSYAGSIASLVAQVTARVNATINTTAGTPQDVDGGATNTSLQIVTSSSLQNAFIDLAHYSSNPTGASFSQTSLGKYITINASAALEGNLTWVIIRMYYTAQDITASGANESELYLYWYNTTSGSWLALNDSGRSGRNTTATPRYVWANVTHFSTFTSASAAATQTGSYAMRNGWNLISIPLGL